MSFNVRSKIETLLWFFRNPQYLPQIFQYSKRFRYSHLENSREESTAWCSENSIENSKALKAVGIQHAYQKIETIFPSIMKQATEKASTVEVQMGGEGELSLLYHLCIGFKVKKVIESGVAYGWSSLAILLAIKDTEGATLISNDMPYVKMDNEDFVGVVVPNEYRNKWELQRSPDISGLPKAFKKMKGSIDLFHYDSDKSYVGRMWASKLIWKHLKPGGLFISDDINDNLAFKHFSENVDRKPIIVEHLGKYVGIIIK